MNTFTTSINDDNIATITIDVIGETMNTLRAEFAGELEIVLSELEDNSALKGVVIISGKKDNFIAGADITMLDDCQTIEDGLVISQMGQKMFDRINALKVPVVAAINGPCLGGGLELAMACDYRVCTDNSKTVLGLPEVQLGLLPGSGGTQRLPKLVGIAKALDLMLTGKQLRAKQALKMGLVDDMVASDILLTTAIELAGKGRVGGNKVKRDTLNKLLESNGVTRKVIFDQATKTVLQKTKGKYPAPLKIIDCVRTGYDKGYSKGLAIEAAHFADLVLSKESASLRRLFFATTAMKKEFGTELATPKEIKQVVVLGGGLMGGGIAHVTAVKANIPVRIKDISQQGISQAYKYSFDLLNKKLKRRFISKTQLQSSMSNITGTTEYNGMKNADIVVEAVFEDLALKHKMVQDVERYCNENTIYASNTSSLPIAQIASVAQRPENVIGLHYFSPVHMMPLVEVIAHEKTSPQTIATTVAFAKKQGKTPIVVKDGAGFYVNRILALYLNEAAYQLAQGCPIDTIDKALCDFGFPIGPMSLIDEVGIDVGAKISPILTEQLGERFEPPAAFEKLIADGRLGKKNQKGFYLYDKKSKGSRQVDASVYKLLNITLEEKSSGVTDIAQRCVVQMLNEAARCLEEGIIASARDGDIGALFGIGFPPFLAGPFSYMDSFGIKKLVEQLHTYQVKYGARFEACQLLKDMSENEQRFYDA